MKLHHKIFLLLFIYLIANQVTAWTYVGHQVISEIAYHNLSQDKQKKLDTVLDTLITALPSDAKKVFKKQPYNLSKIAKLSILPDYWKKMKFQEICDDLNINDNKLLLNLNNRSTATWHYSDKPVPNDNQLDKPNLQENHRSPKNFNQGRLEVVLPQLIHNVKQVNQIRAKALGLVYITHLLEDAHQPLHAVSRKDKGGNGFCLNYNQNSNRCSYNLHQYWDSAAKTIDSNNKKKIYNIINDLISTHKKDSYLKQAQNLSVKDWLSESYKFWPEVYNTPINKYPNKNYQEKTRKIAEDRIILAANRLSTLLDHNLS